MVKRIKQIRFKTGPNFRTAEAQVLLFFLLHLCFSKYDL